MHQNRWLTALPRPLAGFRGLLLRGKGKGGKGKAGVLTLTMLETD